MINKRNWMVTTLLGWINILFEKIDAWSRNLYAELGTSCSREVRLVHFNILTLMFEPARGLVHQRTNLKISHQDLTEWTGL